MTRCCNHANAIVDGVVLFRKFVDSVAVLVRYAISDNMLFGVQKQVIAANVIGMAVGANDVGYFIGVDVVLR